jgi:hypothetical protein
MAYSAGSLSRGWVTTKHANVLLHTRTVTISGYGGFTFPPGNGKCLVADGGKRVKGKLLHSRFNCFGPAESVANGLWYGLAFYMDVLPGGHAFHVTSRQNPSCLGSDCPRP